MGESCNNLKYMYTLYQLAIVYSYMCVYARARDTYFLDTILTLDRGQAQNSIRFTHTHTHKRYMRNETSETKENQIDLNLVL